MSLFVQGDLLFFLLIGGRNFETAFTDEVTKFVYKKGSAELGRELLKDSVTSCRTFSYFK